MAPPVGTLASAAFTITVFAGFATGFLFLIITGIRWARKTRQSIANRSAWRRESLCKEVCSKCGRSLHGRYSIKACSRCSRPTCQLCSVYWEDSYLCTACLKVRDQQLRSGVWTFKELRDRFKSTVAAIRHPQSNNSRDVRDVIEQMTEKLVGGSLDHVRVTRITSHPAYTGFLERYQGVLSLTLSRLSAAVQFAFEELPPPEDESPNHVHLQLKELIREIIHDANSLPVFKGYTRRSRNKVEDLSTQTYEDILATAILNKVIEKFQIYPRRRSKQLIDTGKEDYSDGANSCPNSSDNSMDQGDAWSISTDPLSFTLEEPHKIYSSDEDAFEEKRSDSYYGLYTNCKIPFSDLQQDEQDGEADMFDDYDSSSENWKENWLFKKKTLHNKTTSPVTMLVPSPNDNIKAQIGDTDADETSDLSDYSESDLAQLLNSGSRTNARENFKNYIDTALEKENEVVSKNNYKEKNKNKDYCYVLEDEKNDEVFERRQQERNEKLTNRNPGSRKGLQGNKSDDYTLKEESASSRSRCVKNGNSNNKLQNNSNHKANTKTDYKEGNYPMSTVIEEGTLELPSVKQLAKHFSGKHNHHKVHSLTARNLSRGLQVETKKIIRNDNQEKEVVSDRNIEEMPIPTKVLTNIAFWEQLATKAK